jgi:c(7)-type cytochrome triheme protein
MKTKEKKLRAEKAEKITNKYCKFVLLIFVCLVFGYLMISCSKTEEVTENKALEPLETPTATPTLVEIDPNLDFSEFKHTKAEHERLPCAFCHTRQDNSSKLKFPEHQRCAGCHVQQFEDNSSAICTICHSDAENGEMKGFPSLRNFTANFNHGQHLRQANCATCHKPIRNGVALSIPSRTTAHLTCFQCHKPDTQIGDKNIGSCETCHQKGRPPSAISESAKAFTVSFSHAEHKLNCTNCHNVKAGSGRGRQVNAPVASMHFPPKNAQSCASCHNNKRAFGGDDFSDCNRCHLDGSYKFR